MNKNIPNILTAIRIILVPVICVLIYFHYQTHLKFANFLAILFVFIASITDFFDGRIARKYNIVSNFGRCMDPIADKLLVLSLMVMLIYTNKAWVFPSIIILFREIFISGIREFCAKENNIIIYVSKLAKYKTASQMFSLLFLLMFGNIKYMFYIGNICLTFASILSIITAYKYTISVKDILLSNK